MYKIALITGFSLGLLGCGGGDDPFSGDGGPGNDGAPAADADPNKPDAGPGPDAGPLACADAPARMIVLGDSIVACSNVGGINNASCSPLILNQYIDAEFAAGVTYENKSQGGAVTDDIPSNQLGTIETGIAGHVLVVIFIGGNDLQPYIFIGDAQAKADFAEDMPAMLAEWDKIFEFFDDTSKFPDGYTMIMNTQYNPFDDCTASPYFLSAVKIDLLHQYNDNLKDLANARSNVVITDQHKSYLGHGHHYNEATCPHYFEGAVGWMADLIHPDNNGHANLANEWATTADRLYLNCIE